MSQPSITIIVSVLNRQETLEECIQSIIEQSWLKKELIVIDGGSTDGSLDILKQFSPHIAFWESQQDNGIYHAWNKGLRYASGEWICFIGADDFFWNPSVLHDISPYLTSSYKNQIRVVYGKVAKLNQRGKIIRVLGKPWQRISWQMRHGMPKDLPHPGLMHHHSLFKEHGLFDESFSIAGDYDLLLNELIHKKAYCACNLILVGSRAGGIADISGLKTNAEVARAKKKHNLTRFSWLWTVVYIRNFLFQQWQKITR